MRHYRPSLTASIMAFLGCLLLITWLLFSLLAFKTAANDLYAQKGEHAKTLLSAFVSQLPENIPVYPESIISPESSASMYVQKLLNDAAFTRLTLLDLNGKVVFTAGKDGSESYLPFENLGTADEGSYIQGSGSRIVQVINISRNGVVAGRAGIALSLAQEKQRLNRSRQILLLYFLLDFLLLFFLGSFILSRIVVNPINRLLAITEKITSGQYGQIVKVSGSAELARLADAFNDMSGTLAIKEQQVHQHVTALEAANRELTLAREESIRAEKMASIGLLAAGMAHEIGTPLAAIMGYAELLSTDHSDEETLRDYSRRISEDCSRIDRIVRGLLDYSRPRVGTTNESNVQQLVMETAALLLQQGAIKHVEVVTRFEEDLPSVQADPYQLQQVLVNLMLNSRDAMAGKGTLSVIAELDTKIHTNSEVRIDVIDSGSGIAPEHLKKIFDPFFTTKPPGKGTGLGLAIVARIIEGFGGRIEVSSNQGSGTCFSIYLAVARAGVDSGR